MWPCKVFQLEPHTIVGTPTRCVRSTLLPLLWEKGWASNPGRTTPSSSEEPRCHSWRTSRPHTSTRALLKLLPCTPVDEEQAELALPLLALAAQLVRCPASTNGAFATCSNSPIKALGDAQGSCGHAHRRWCRRGSEPCGRARTLCMNVHAEQSIRTGHDKSLCMMIFSLCVCTCTHVAATPALTEQPRI